MSSARVSKPSLFRPIADFFYREETPYGLALVRMVFPVACTAPLIYRSPWIRELYSADGAPHQVYEVFGQGSPLPLFPPAVVAALFGLMLFAFLSTIIGWKTRTSLATATVLYIYFNQLDIVGTMTKYSVISSHVLVLLTLSRCGAVWSVDAVLKRRREGTAPSIPPRFPVWPARLIQLLFSYVYFGAAITKIETDAFFSGEQMRYWMLSNWNYSNPLGEVLSMWIPLLLVSAYITVVWEIVFGFMAWRPVGRPVVLFVGATFHLLTFVLLGLRIFPAVCISCYLAFVNEHDVVLLRRLVHRLRIPTAWLHRPRFLLASLLERRPVAVPAGVVWGVVAAVVCVGSIEAEYQHDLYGIRRNGGPLPLQPMKREVAEAMLHDRRPLRERDKFFSFDIGGTLVGEQLASRRTEFTFGERLFAQCNLNPPHDDLWVSVSLVDADDHVIDRKGQIVTRDQLHQCFSYFLGNRLVPGEYGLILHSNGKEIARRSFTLTGDPNSVAQMQMMSN
ncbi:MAG: HTTM domain-containing protein [Planctomycetaceae bacterium]|nr:HTTM domain-containing protein [Planctomycetaceae bacterium]